MIAMEFTSNYIHMVEGKTSGRGALVKKMISIPMTPHNIRNGYIRNKDEIGNSILDTVLEQNIKDKNVSITLDSTALKVKEMELPYEPRERALQFMKREMGTVISDEEYILDYIIHDVFKVKQKKYMHCTILAIPREFLLSYLEVIRKTGLKLKYIDTLNDSIEKKLELQYPNVKRTGALSLEQPKKKTNKKPNKKSNKKNMEITEEVVEEPLKEKEIEGPIKLWVGLYYEKIKLMTNGIDGNLLKKTVMLESTVTKEQTDSQDSEASGEGEKELIALYINEIKKILKFQENSNPEDLIEEIEVYGEHPMLEQICKLTSSFVNVPTSMLKCPKHIKGVSDQEYAKYVGVIGSLLRR